MEPGGSRSILFCRCFHKKRWGSEPPQADQPTQDRDFHMKNPTLHMNSRALPIKSSALYRKGSPNHIKSPTFYRFDLGQPRNGRILHMKGRPIDRKTAA